MPHRYRPGGRPQLTLVIDPRFSGGTSSAVAHEIRALAGHADVTVHAVSSKMFKGKDANPRLQQAFDDLGIEPVWDAKVITGDTVVIHNPSFLKFNAAFTPRISCERLVCVTHENFLTPQGEEGFDINLCLGMIESASVCGSRHLSPVSASNRRGVQAWLSGSQRAWGVTPFDWFNICDFTLVDPVNEPSDRRGRMSRPGWEKFPDTALMAAHFPFGSVNRILGGDSYLTDPSRLPLHWDVMPFGAEDVSAFLASIDFFVYFTNERWRESFGRVIAEAIAAGKVVITDPATGENFGGSVITSDGTDVNAIIHSFISDPAKYAAFVRRAQQGLSRFGQEEFLKTVLGGAVKLERGTHAVF